jgi:hypothetical protein
MPITNSPALQNCLAFAARGFPVFPLHGIADGRCTCGNRDWGRTSGKHPFARFAPNGFRSATINRALILSWFEAHPWLNYGVSTDRLPTVDVDPRNGGDESWRKLVKENWLPHTWEAVTGGDGRHLMFGAGSNPVQCGQLARGVDIKGIGGYIVGVGSQHLSGKPYRWAAQCKPTDFPESFAPPMALPLWIVEKLTATTGPKPIEFYRKIAREPVLDGSRNDLLAKLSAHLFAQLIEPDLDLIHDIMQGWNLGRCQPPLEAAEVENIVAGVAAREFRKRGEL